MGAWLRRRLTTTLEIASEWPVLLLLWITVAQLVGLLMRTGSVFSVGQYIGKGDEFVAEGLFRPAFYEIARDTSVFVSELSGSERGGDRQGWACVARLTRPFLVHVPGVIVVKPDPAYPEWCMAHEVGHFIDSHERGVSTSSMFVDDVARAHRELVSLGSPSQEPEWAYWMDRCYPLNPDNPVELWADLFMLDCYPDGKPKLSAVPPSLRGWVADYLWP